MRVFEKPNTSSGWVCPICKTSKEEPVTLIPIEGTQKGRNAEAEQFHVDCIDIWYIKASSEKPGIIYQFLD